MKTKDVEKLTGLTAKSIRFYESKGLIHVDRQEENDYRNYTEENVAALKRIKIFRYLGFSVEQIKVMMDCSVEEIKQSLLKRAEEFTEQEEEIGIKRNICQSLSNDIGKKTGKDIAYSDQIFEEYNGIVQFMEEDEIGDTIKALKYPTLPENIATTLICLGPIIWLFVNIHLKRWDMLTVNALLAVMGTVIATLEWQRYITARKNLPARMKKNNKKSWVYTVTIIAACVLGFVLLLGILKIFEVIFTPEGWLFYERPVWAENLLMICIFIPVIYIVYAIPSIDKPFRFTRKTGFIVIPLWIIMLYACLSRVDYVTENEIIHCTPFHPMGEVYAYQDVTKIETGFGQKTFSFNRHDRKGNFYYRVFIDDIKIEFSQPSVNSKIDRFSDTYVELEEFDAALMKQGIPKEGSDDGYQNMDYDKVYVDRFRRIISNK